MDRTLDLKYKRLWFMAVCRDCGHLRMPFKDGVERDAWKAQHTANIDPQIGRTHNVNSVVEIWED
jgi:hypothetical protein